MKIKINNIFKNTNLNKDKIHTTRRRNLKNIQQLKKEKKYNENYKILNRQYIRKGATNDKNIFKNLELLIGKLSEKKSYYVLFFFMIVLAFVSVYTNIVTYRDTNNESYMVFSNNDVSNEKKEEQSSITQDLTSNNKDTRINSDSPKKTISTIENKTSLNVKKNTSKATTNNVLQPLDFIKPLNGEIIKIYSVDKVLFSKTLDSWKTHDGVDIKSDIGVSVKSIEKGIIERIYEDSFLGTTVIIDHGQGYKSIYSNLDSSVSVKEKQVIKKGALIGKVGQTSIGEIKDESHIHFMMMLNNKAIDPTGKINF